jgi:protoporphyrinogen oxidase
VAQRIKGVSLTVAIRDAFFKSDGRKIASLTERFLYPDLGIGRISDRFQEEIEETNPVYLNCSATRVNHDGTRITSVVARNQGSEKLLKGGEFISSIPLTRLVTMLHPKAPSEVLKAAEALRYRDTIIVAAMIDRDRVTDLTWIYFPERKIPFGRIHEPKNWSAKMAPPGKTTIVAEYFCFKGDNTWNTSDRELVGITVKNLVKLGFIKEAEVIDSTVLRIRKAYPLLEVGYRRKYDKIIGYLRKFENLQIIGRGGMFRYHNMDHAIETGIKAAENLLGKKHDLHGTNHKKEYLEEIYQP